MKKIFKTILIILLLLLLGFIGYFVYQNFFSSNSVNSITINSIKGYDYKLTNRHSSYFKKEFQNLKSILESDEIDEEEYAKSVSKLFLSDFFNLSNKIAKTDVGGIQFLMPTIRSNFALKAENTIYKYIENNLSGSRKQNLPTVKSIKINKIEKQTYSYSITKEDEEQDNKVDSAAYIVYTNINYQGNSNYQDTATLVLVHQDKYLYIAELNE